jgi:hypothetical protein
MMNIENKRQPIPGFRNKFFKTKKSKRYGVYSRGKMIGNLLVMLAQSQVGVTTTTYIKGNDVYAVYSPFAPLTFRITSNNNGLNSISKYGEKQYPGYLVGWDQKNGEPITIEYTLNGFTIYSGGKERIKSGAELQPVKALRLTSQCTAYYSNKEEFCFDKVKKQSGVFIQSDGEIRYLTRRDIQDGGYQYAYDLHHEKSPVMKSIFKSRSSNPIYSDGAMENLLTTSDNALRENYKNVWYSVLRQEFKEGPGNSYFGTVQFLGSGEPVLADFKSKRLSLFSGLTISGDYLANSLLINNVNTGIGSYVASLGGKGIGFSNAGKPLSDAPFAPEGYGQESILKSPQLSFDSDKTTIRFFVGKDEYAVDANEKWHDDRFPGKTPIWRKETTVFGKTPETGIYIIGLTDQLYFKCQKDFSRTETASKFNLGIEQDSVIRSISPNMKYVLLSSSSTMSLVDVASKRISRIYLNPSESSIDQKSSVAWDGNSNLHIVILPSLTHNIVNPLQIKWNELFPKKDLVMK